MIPSLLSRAVVACCFISVVSVVTAGGEMPALTLEDALRQALAVSPELREARLEVSAREGALDQAGTWPNPSIELRADQKVGIQDGNGGGDLSQVAVKQPLPLLRLPAQRARARAELDEAREHLRFARLQREAEAARAVHMLQFGQARMTLAAQREAFVAGMEPGAQRKDRIVRYMTPLERSRLAILREQAAQGAASAEGEYSEALAEVRALMALPPDAAPRMVALSPVVPPPALAPLLEKLDQHPALAASDRDIEAARAAIDVARSQRFADPVLGVFRERDYLGGQARDYSGVTLGIEVPLWNRQAGEISRARAETDQAQERRNALRRNLESRLRQTHMHLNHLIEQAANHRERLLAPARQGLDLARRGFIAGEQNLLTLIDAYDTAFDAEVRYQELLELAWQEAAELRLAAGTALLPEAAP